MNKKYILHLLVTGLILWSPFLTSNVNAQRPNTPNQDSPFPDDNPVAVGGERNSNGSEAGAAAEEESDKQMIMINSRYAGWEEASRDGGKRVGDQLRGNWIMVDSNGRFGGQVRPTAGADVAGMNVFLMNMGRLVKQTTVDQNGNFEFNNVRQGAYSLIGWGDKGMFAFGMNVLASNPKSEGVLNELKITAFQNKTTINTDWIRHFTARVTYRVFGRYPTEETADDPASLYGFSGLVNHTPESVPATSISSHPVSKTADGRLIGRVHQLNSISGRPVDVRTTKVMLLQGDDVVASTSTDNFGVFEFQQVPNGSYAVVAAGVDGVGLIGIDVGGSAGAMNDIGEFVGGEYPIDFTLISSETMGWLNHYASEVSYRRALLTPRPQVAKAPAPIPYTGNGVCPSCQNRAGGCNDCQNAYLLSMCRSRGLTFEQWQMYCQGKKLPGPLGLNKLRSQFGNGEILSKAAEQIKRNSQKIDKAFDRAFYPDNDAQQIQELNNLSNQMRMQQYQQQQYAPQYAPQQFAPQQNYAPVQNFIPQQQMIPQQNLMQPRMIPQQNIQPQNLAPQFNGSIPMGGEPSLIPPIVQPREVPSVLESALRAPAALPPIVQGTGSRIASGTGVVERLSF